MIQITLIKHLKTEEFVDTFEESIGSFTDEGALYILIFLFQKPDGVWNLINKYKYKYKYNSLA